MRSRLRSISVFALALASLFVSSAIAKDSSPPHALIRSMQSVVSVLPVWPKDTRRREEPEGTGVVIGNGRFILTANHVLGHAKEVYVRSIDGHISPATIAGRDQSTDIALLEIPSPLPPISFAKKAEVFERTCAIGNSFGLGLSVSCGVISAVDRSGVGFNDIEDFIQTDAAVNPGMSGGALVNVDGEFMGLLSAIFTKTSDSNIGVNFAVSSRLVSNVIADIQDNGIIDRPRSGLRLAKYPAAKKTGLLSARVMAIQSNSPEIASGVQVGDLLIWANDRRIKHPADYRAALALLNSNKKLHLKVNRGGQQVEIIINF